MFHPLNDFKIQRYYHNKQRFNGVYSSNWSPNSKHNYLPDTKDEAYVMNYWVKIIYLYIVKNLYLYNTSLLFNNTLFNGYISNGFVDFKLYFWNKINIDIKMVETYSLSRKI